jgi:hypothetical protein
MVRVHLFNELLLEGGFDPMTNPLESDVSDRCYFKFNEIDVDTQVKKETHTIQKFTSNLIGLSEARMELGMDAEHDPKDFYAAIQSQIQINANKKQTELSASLKSKDATMNADKQEPAQKGQTNLPNKRKGAGNVIRPTNQQGRNTSANIRRSDNAWLTLVENALESEYTIVYTNDEKDEINVEENDNKE